MGLYYDIPVDDRGPVYLAKMLRSWCVVVVIMFLNVLTTCREYGNRKD
jgi:hypothetical protein